MNEIYVIVYEDATGCDIIGYTENEDKAKDICATHKYWSYLRVKHLELHENPFIK